MNKRIAEIIKNEEERQKTTLGLIPSENYSSKAVREAVGSVLMHKYSEGYPGARYYEGNENIDVIENLCREMVLKVMLKHSNASTEDWHANVQPPSGSIANMVVYNANLNVGDKILGMYLPDGGHLSHGWSYTPTSERAEEQNDIEMIYKGGTQKLTLNSKIFNVVQYKTDPEKNYQFNYDEIERIATEEKPKLIITGGTAYPREIDYKRIREIADKVGAYYLADVAHEAGLIAGGAMNSPFEFADFVTFTTHKTLRGPKGAVVMCKKEFAKKIDKSVIPGMLGGPLNHTIAGITQALFEADTKEFEQYAHQVVKNAKVFAEELLKLEYDVVSGGTDKHLILVNLSNKSIGGKYFSRALAHAGIIANMNTVPYEKGSPINPSGIRFGTPILTTRGMKEEQMKLVVSLINDVYEEVKNYADLKFSEFEEKIKDLDAIKEVRSRVLELCEKFELREE